MSRRALVAAFAVAVVSLAVGAPASAKGPDSATVSGPGIGTTTITWNRPDRSTLGTLTEATFLWDTAGTAGWDTQPPPGDLGPRYTVVYHIVELNNRLRGDDIRQDMYPFAEAGPVVYMPPDQHMYGTASASGWHASDDQMALALNHLGARLPSNGPARAAPAGADTVSVPTDDSTSPWGFVTAGAVAVVLIALVGFGWRRHRPRPRLAR